MRLLGLSMQGFKSFPDRMNIDFTDGLTAIVGPNGSGKSNISDAVRWVLGEMSAKSLRGGKMEDVIFNGTKVRKPFGYAEVSLTLDNSDRFFAYDFNELTVTRRYFRSGESEYYINKQPVRLKDINELFMDTGLGRDGYSMIGQGKISEILSSKSDDRRQIFEEAAGISKFRYRKTEAERKLTAAEDNLVRLHDILAELEARVGPLKEQSEKAKKYLVLRDEKKSLEVNVWLDSIDKMTDTVRAAEEKYRIAGADLESANAAAAKTEAEINSLFEKTASLNAESDALARSAAELRDSLSSGDGRAIEIKANIGRDSADVERLNCEIGSFGERRAELEKELDAKNAEAAAARKKIAELDAAMAKDLEQSELFARETGEAAEKARKLQNEIAANQSRQTALLVEGGSVSAGVSGAEAELERLGRELEAAGAEAKNRKAALTGYETARAELESRRAALKNVLDGWNLKRASKSTAAESAKSELASFDARMASMKDRLNLLTDMEKNYVGFYNSTKSVMDAASRGAIKGVETTVAEAIRTDDRYALAMETLLGAALQNIITDSEDSAKAAVAYLKANDLGRATFLPMNAVRGGVLNGSELKNSEGYIGVASELVSFEPKYKNVIEFLLGRSAVVETIGDAIKLARAFGYRFRAVTLDGQLINAGGSITGGSSVKRVGVFTRANEMEELKKKLSEADSAREKLANAASLASSALAELAAKADGAAAELRTAEEEYIKAESDEGHARLVAETAAEAVESLAAALEAKKEYIASEQSKKEENARLAAECAVRAKELETELAAALGSGSDSESRQKVLFDEIAAKRLEISGLTKDAETAQLLAAETVRRMDEHSASAGEREKLILTIKEHTALLENELAGIEASKAKLADEINAAEQRQQKLRTERDAADTAISELRRREKEDAERAARLTADVARLEAKSESARNEYDAIVTRLWDDYELTLTEAESLRTPLESIQKANKRISEIKKDIKELGDVNVAAIAEYAEVSERYETLGTQYKDITGAKEELLKIVGELTAEMQRIFGEQFSVINKHFNEVFRELFGGGEASLVLEEPDDLLNSGIEFRVTPPGKVIRNMSSLSGGEQALVAIALYFAILKVRPAPFCILDEIEAALDDVNVVRFAEYLKTVNGKTQFIVITHRRGTMEAADVLYGVTMQEKGVSKLLVINVSDLEKHFPDEKRA